MKVTSSNSSAPLASAMATPTKHHVRRTGSRLSAATVDTIEEGLPADIGLPSEVHRVDSSDDGSNNGGGRRRRYLALAALLLAVAAVAVVCAVIFTRPSSSNQAAVTTDGANGHSNEMWEEELAEKDAEIESLLDEIAGLEEENEALSGMAVYAAPEEVGVEVAEGEAEVDVPKAQAATDEVEEDEEEGEGGLDGPVTQDGLDAAVVVVEPEVQVDAEPEAIADEPAEAAVVAQDTQDLLGVVVAPEDEEEEVPSWVMDLAESSEDAVDEPAAQEAAFGPEDEEAVGAPLIQDTGDASEPEVGALEGAVGAVDVPLADNEDAVDSLDDGESVTVLESALISPVEAPVVSDVDEDAAPPPPADESYDAVVVGAGWAGIRAAQVLSADGHSVLVLEANDYIGGRSKSVDSALHPGVATDFGSEWLYLDSGVGTQEEYLLDSGLIDDAPEHPDMFAGGRLYAKTVGADGVPTARVMEEADALTDRLWGQFMEYKKDILKAMGDVTYADALERFIDEKDIASNEDQQYLNYLVDLLEQEFAGDASDMSLEEVDAFFFEEGCEVDTIYMPGVGFGNVATSIANGVDAEFRLNAQVTEIDHEGDDVILSYEVDGVARQVTARTALVTVSLGVLKAGTISFRPELPASKRDAIDGMGYGLLNKAVMYWSDEDDIVWPNGEWFELVTPEDESSGVWTSFFNPSEMKGGVPNLIGWIAGNEAEAMEEQSDEEIMSQIMANLRLMFPDIREPDEVIITRWGQEEHFRGSYSFNVVGRDFNDDAANLREPVGNVWFAGEATNTDGWHATTLAAWESGERAADEMASVLED
ncbi:hypothetical protein ACHAXT_005962 [Thalassiosira profunda]